MLAGLSPNFPGNWILPTSHTIGYNDEYLSMYMYIHPHAII